MQKVGEQLRGTAVDKPRGGHGCNEEKWMRLEYNVKESSQHWVMD